MMWRRIAIAVGVIAAAAGAWVVVGPTQIGGPVTYVIASGDSMEPGIRSGDLMLVRTADDYDVGDVVAYRNRMMRRVVVHRIVDVEDGRYVLKGDNNDWLDSYHPSGSEIVGTPWVRVPGVGRILSGMSEPRNAGLLAGVLTLLSIGGTGVRRHRRTRARRAADPRPPERASGAVPQRPRGAWALPAGATCLVLALVSGALAVWAGGQPERRSASRNISFTQRGAFEYSAKVPAGEVYPEGAATTGDPLFMEVVTAADVRFEYSFESEAAAALEGTASLSAELTDESGWHREFVLQGPASFEGTHAVVRGRLDVAGLRAILSGVQETTGVSRPQYRLTLRPDVSVRGTVAGVEIEETWAPELPILVEPKLLRVEKAMLDGTVTADPLDQAKAGSVAVAGTEANRIGIAGVGLRPSTVPRPAAIASGLLALAAIVLLARSRGRMARRDEAGEIEARYGKWLVPVLKLPDGGRVVDVASFEGLVRLAEQYEALVLHTEHGGAHVYAVHAHDVLYRYDVGTTGLDLHAVASEAIVPATDHHHSVPAATPVFPVPAVRPVSGREA